MFETIPRTPEEHRRFWSENTDVPYGECWCGCKAKTKLARVSDAPKWEVRDCPRRYIHNHHRRSYVTEYKVVDTGYETPCWISNRGKMGEGYAVTWVDGKYVRTHKLFYEACYGLVPGGMFLDHLCVSRTKGRAGSVSCVNPDHLEPVTRTENNRRSRNTKLTIEKAREIRRLSAEDNLSQGKLAKNYGVNKKTIHDVLKNKIWKEL